MQPYLGFYTGPEDSNSGPRACRANAPLSHLHAHSPLWVWVWVWCVPFLTGSRVPQASPLLTVWVRMTLEFSSSYLQFPSVGIADMHAVLGISPKGFTHLMHVIYQLLHPQPVLKFLRTQSFRDYTFCVISGDRSGASRILQSDSRCSQMRIGNKVELSGGAFFWQHRPWVQSLPLLQTGGRWGWQWQQNHKRNNYKVLWWNQTGSNISTRFMLCVCCFVWICMLFGLSQLRVCLMPNKVKEGFKSPGTEVMDGCEPPCPCCVLNPGLLQDHQMLLTAEPSLQPNRLVLFS